MKLEEIGFYTLSEERCKTSSEDSNIMRAEIILTDKCNFKCPYCRGLLADQKGEMPFEEAVNTLQLLIDNGLTNVRFSGGEPTTYKDLHLLVWMAAQHDVKNIAISTNGTAPLEHYLDLIKVGVTDFSISLDSCCASFNKEMTGGVDAFDIVTSNIRELSKLTYVTVGVVITEDNYKQVPEIVEFAHNLGVADIRIIPSAQWDQMLEIANKIPQHIIDAHPILAYRVNNIRNGIHVRGIKETDSRKCGIVLDDIAIVKDKFYPCIIWMREHGEAIGTMGPNFRQEMKEWFDKTDTHENPICKKNCLDCIVLFNKKHEDYRK